MLLLYVFLVVPADSSCPEDHYQCRNPEQCVAFENLCTVDWNFGTISQDASHRCYDQLYNLYRDAASLSVAASAFPWHQFAMASRSALMALMKISVVFLTASIR